jgi:hypothetical protein
LRKPIESHGTAATMTIPVISAGMYRRGHLPDPRIHWVRLEKIVGVFV